MFFGATGNAPELACVGTLAVFCQKIIVIQFVLWLHNSVLFVKNTGNKL
jgi:hypothetical protein